MYSSYTAEQIARTYELADLHSVNLLGAVTWAFEFEDQPYFDGFRDLATNGIDKPVLNVFRMLGQMGGDRVRSTSSGGLRARRRARRSACATRRTSARSRADRRVPSPCSSGTTTTTTCRRRTRRSTLTIAGVPGGRVRLTHYRVDREHSNAYEAWKQDGIAAAAVVGSSTPSWRRPASSTRSSPRARSPRRTALSRCRSRCPGRASRSSS